MKTADTVFAFGVLLLFIFMLCSYLTDSFLTGLAVSVCVGAMTFLSYKSFNKKENRRKNRSTFFNNILLYGKEYSDRLISYLIPTNAHRIENKDYIILNGRKKTLILNNIKYGNANEEDVAKIFRINLLEKCEKVIMFCRDIDKKALTLLSTLTLEYRIVNIKNLHRLAEKKGLIHEDSAPNRPKPKLRVLVKNTFSVKSMRYFLFSALGLSLLSLITPLKLYYLIFSGINLILGLSSFFISGKDKVKDDLFEG